MYLYAYNNRSQNVVTTVKIHPCLLVSLLTVAALVFFIFL